jgi:hypothetical protein
MGYGMAGSISPKAAKKLTGKLAVLRKTRPQKSKMAAFEHKGKDEGQTPQAAIHPHEIDQAATQAKRGVGTVSKGGGIGKPESHLTAEHIDQPENKKVWPKGGDVRASNPATGNTRMKGPIAKTGGPYGGGGRDTQ